MNIDKADRVIARNPFKYKAYPLTSPVSPALLPLENKESNSENAIHLYTNRLEKYIDLNFIIVFLVTVEDLTISDLSSATADSREETSGKQKHS
jgi:hypothetical protein